MGRQADVVNRHNIADDGSWQYSGKHADYPVRPGDVWKVDRHLFVCSDAEQDQQPWTRAGVRTESVTFVYADPPYSAGIARSYRRKAGIDGGTSAPVDFPVLIGRFVSAARLAGTVAYLEAGVKTVDQVADACTHVGAKITGRWNITFYGKQPACLIAADFRPDPAADHPDFEGADDEHTPAIAIAHWAKTHPNGTVLDPCSGRGLTSRSADAGGYRSVNLELSQYRIAEALHRLHKVTGSTPIKVVP